MYEFYKPFRNRLRTYSVIESLHSAFRFIQFLDFDVPLPQNLAPSVPLSRDDRIQYGIVQWEFEILIREIVLNCDKHSKKSLNSWNAIARELNAIKDIENQKWRGRVRQDGDMLYELVRIAHRQFPWQKGLPPSHVARHSRLYEFDGLSEMVFAKYQMSHREILQLGLALAGHFLQNFSIQLPIQNEINQVDATVCNKFVDRFSITIEDLRSQYQKLSSYDINWAYTFNPLRKTPLVLLDASTAICPIPMFLFRRITNELYFDLVTESEDFSKYFGPAVQSLIGEVASKVGEGKSFRSCTHKMIPNFLKV